MACSAVTELMERTFLHIVNLLAEKSLRNVLRYGAEHDGGNQASFLLQKGANNALYGMKMIGHYTVQLLSVVFGIYCHPYSFIVMEQ